MYSKRRKRHKRERKHVYDLSVSIDRIDTNAHTCAQSMMYACAGARFIVNGNDRAHVHIILFLTEAITH